MVALPGSSIISIIKVVKDATLWALLASRHLVVSSVVNVYMCFEEDASSGEKFCSFAKREKRLEKH